MFVLAFGRDQTLDVNPPPDGPGVPLEWIIYWAHEADYEVWSIGNQDLVYEAGIPGMVEAVRQYDGNLDKFSEKDGGRYDWWSSRERRLELLADLFSHASKRIVVDHHDLSHVEGWEHYTAAEFNKTVKSGRLSRYLHSPPAASDSEHNSSEDYTDLNHVETIRQQLRTAVEVEISIGENEQEKFRATSWTKPRPSALPIDSPPTLDFTTVTGETRRIQLPDITDVSVIERNPSLNCDQNAEQASVIKIKYPELSVLRGRVLLAESLPTVQRVAFTIDVLKTATQLSAYPKLLMDAFVRAVENVPANIESPVVQASAYAVQHPAHLRNHVDELSQLIGVSDTEVSRCAVWCLMHLAEEYPVSVVGTVPSLSAVLSTEDEKTRKYATYTLSLIAELYPEELLPAIDTLFDQLDTRDGSIQTNTLSAVGHVATSYPGAAAEHVESIAAVLDSDKKRVRNNAAGILADLAQEHPSDVIEYADILTARLADPNIQARINASIALIQAGEADPEAVRDQYQQLEDTLTDPSPDVRANVCTLIGNAEAPVSMIALRDLLVNDPNETVRDHAARAIRRLST